MSTEARRRDGKLGRAEYPCVRRFRHRRLLAFLWLQGFKTIVESMLSESDTVFGVLRLRDFVERGQCQWRDALNYLSRFVPWPDDKPKRPLSIEAEVLHRFLWIQMNLAGTVTGTKEKPIQSQYLSHDRNVCHGEIRLRSIVLNVIYARQQLRTSIDWERVRDKAGEIVQDLACRTPELKDRVYVPGILVEPHNVLPIGFGFRRRCHPKKQTRRPRASALAKFYLEKRRSLPATLGPSQESCSDMSESKALDWLADIVDECLKAGKRPEYHQAHPLQTSGTEGATVAPVSQTVFSGLTCPAINPGMPSVAAEVTNASSKLASHVPINGAPVSQAAFGCLTSRCQYSDVRLMANSGATAVPVSQTIFGSLSCPPINHRMPSTSNAGKLASHVPTHGAPFLGTIGAPLSHAIFGSLTTHCENSGVPLMAKAAAGAPVPSVSQMMDLTSHAGDSGAGH